jgi:hypothetical protein
MGIFTEANKANEEMPGFSCPETHGRDARATTSGRETALDKKLGMA